MAEEKFVLKLVVDNTRGVMARIATLLARKGYNIESICVGSHLESGEASIILTIRGTELEVEVAKNMLGKLINVISIELFCASEATEREHCLIKMKKIPGAEEKLKGYDARVLRENHVTMVVEIVSHPDKIEKLLEGELKGLIIDISRSGCNAMSIK